MLIHPNTLKIYGFDLDDIELTYHGRPGRAVLSQRTSQDGVAAGQRATDKGDERIGLKWRPHPPSIYIYHLWVPFDILYSPSEPVFSLRLHLCWIKEPPMVIVLRVLYVWTDYRSCHVKLLICKHFFLIHLQTRVQECSTGRHLSTFFSIQTRGAGMNQPEPERYPGILVAGFGIQCWWICRITGTFGRKQVEKPGERLPQRKTEHLRHSWHSWPDVVPVTTIIIHFNKSTRLLQLMTQRIVSTTT